MRRLLRASRQVVTDLEAKNDPLAANARALCWSIIAHLPRSACVVSRDIAKPSY
jgi:hypothetical protein